jgi:ADP-ribose pyrophosphatase YjhB (NUDIX family)
MSNNQFYISENNVPFKELFIYGLLVDCVIFGYYNNNIQVLLIERGAEPYKHQWALLGD